MTSEQRSAMQTIDDLRARLERAERRIVHLEAEKKTALAKKRKWKDEARHWHGVAIRLAPSLAGKRRAA